MKISELLNEVAGKDFSAVIDQLEQTSKFKDFSEVFDLKSTKQQRKNGSLQIATKPEILKEPREFFVNYSGTIKVKNGYSSIWANAGKAYGTAGSLELYLDCLNLIHQHFVDWFAKRLRTAKGDVSNLNLKTLEGRVYPKKLKEFNCSHNHLTSLEGAPTVFEPKSDFYVNDNYLTSPLTHVPDVEFRIFSAGNNKLTSFEGFPRRASFIHIQGNPFHSFSDVHKHIDWCEGFNLPQVKTGVLAFFKVNECRSINFSGAPNGSEFEMVSQIVSKYLRENRNMLECQEELMDNGLKAFAKL